MPAKCIIISGLIIDKLDSNEFVFKSKHILVN